MSDSSAAPPKKMDSPGYTTATSRQYSPGRPVAGSSSDHGGGGGPSTTYQQAIFALMSLIPGQIWSELGDICESEDYNGNRVVVFSHTLHFDLLASSGERGPAWGGMQTPYLSVPATPHVGTPSVSGRFPSGFQAALVSRMASQTSLLGERLRLAGGEPSGGTTWPLQWLLAELSPRTLAARLARFDLTLSTRLQFNEQARIVSHEDIWGIKQLVECLAPAFLVHIYSCNRWLIGIAADLLSRNYLRSSSDAPPPSDAHQHSAHPPDQQAATALHSPIFIGSHSPLLHIHIKPPSKNSSHNRTPSQQPAPAGIFPDADDDDDELNTEAGSLDDPRPI
ncbi:hypothetical protein PtA15_6A661 [Puccinia triticina]|uniref:Uncharacterized protein n=1 Tax=Puccinia triticina TaxID=208348 RepID=A0ABY7CLB8_9BASI|nr:uncharacterized protein PtA15_6A661 [Puccinia triticina]WAQ86031.1 hypothetical protein PtA15_6A661 [Puccinia triticina]